MKIKENLKLVKEHYEELQKRSKETNEQLNKLYEDKQVLNYLKVYGYINSDFFQNLDFEEDIMHAVLTCYTFYSEEPSIYIDEGLYLVTRTDPMGIGATSRLIKESDLEYINNIINNSSNPIIKQHILHHYVGLENNLCTKNIKGENKTIIKLPSLIKRESEITPLELDNKIDFARVKAYYKGDDEKNGYLPRLTVLRTQFFLKMLENNLEEVLEYYRNPENWAEIDKNVDNYYVKKESHEASIINKVYTKILLQERK